MDTKKTLLVEDHNGIRKALSLVLENKGYQVDSFSSTAEALSYFKGQPDYPGIVLTDFRFDAENTTGSDLLQDILEIDNNIPVILLTAYGTVKLAVEAMKQGCFDFLEKSEEDNFNAQALAKVVDHAWQVRQAELETRSLRRRTLGGIGSQLVGQTQRMQELQQTIMQVAPTPLNVLIIGESGTGKEVVAGCLHRFGDRQHGPFEQLNCARPEADTFETTLFGHEYGAFPGATEMYPGYLERAHQGTLFLDEIESMPVDLQAKLLRALEENQVIRLGGRQAIDIDIRVVAAIKTDPQELIDTGRLRQDLYYRLAGFVLTLPPLRERLYDLPLLWEHFISELEREENRLAPKISQMQLAQLAQHEWAGNVRELKHTAARFFYLGPENAFPASNGSEGDAPATEGKDLLTAQVEAFERRLILDILRAHDHNVSQAARACGINRKTLEYRIRKYGLGGGSSDL